MKKVLLPILALIMAFGLTLSGTRIAEANGPGWVLLETLTVDAQGMPTTSDEILLDGWLYRFEVSGTYGAGAGITADAEYSSGPNSYDWQDVVENYESEGECLLELMVDNTCVEWGEYNSNHVYTLDYTGTGNTVAFHIYDIFSNNNTGELTVKIYAQPVKVSTAIVSGEPEVGVGAEESWDIEITVDVMYADVEDVIVKDGMGADLDGIELNGTPVAPGDLAVNVTSGEAQLLKMGKGIKGANMVIWDIGDLDYGDTVSLVVTVTTGFNAKDMHEFTSVEEDHALDGGASATYWYDEIEYETPETIPVTVDVVAPRLYLYQKNPVTWEIIISETTWGLLTYNFKGKTFDYTFSATGLDSATKYSLIYYADPWPGDGGTLIATFTTDGSGDITSTSNSVNLGMDLPSTGDENYPDGAKIWLVPSSDYTEGTGMTSWNPENYLFENNMITYYN